MLLSALKFGKCWCSVSTGSDSDSDGHSPEHINSAAFYQRKKSEINLPDYRHYSEVLKRTDCHAALDSAKHNLFYKQQSCRSETL